MIGVWLLLDPRIMYTDESRGVPLYVNNYGKADHGGPFNGPQVPKN